MQNNNPQQQTTKKILRIPPQSLDSEKAVLGSILVRPGALIEIADIVFPDSFYAEKHRHIYQSMIDLSSKNEPIDLLSVSHKLDEKKMLEKIGGRSYIAELTETVPHSTNVKHYAEIVKKKHTLRSLIEAADFISDVGFAESE